MSHSSCSAVNVGVGGASLLSEPSVGGKSLLSEPVIGGESIEISNSYHPRTRIWQPSRQSPLPELVATCSPYARVSFTRVACCHTSSVWAAAVTQLPPLTLFNYVKWTLECHLLTVSIRHLDLVKTLSQVNLAESMGVTNFLHQLLKQRHIVGIGCRYLIQLLSVVHAKSDISIGLAYWD